ncbi:MAG TPA: hypothetical protein VFL13_03880 [Candidatus Baltobacteraceae bacterium]|nr:hypothetical protein [Candidatus Baltobacteraceae bacterium]
MTTRRIAPALACTLSVLVLWPILLRPGLPAYQHDWSMPFDRTRVLSGAIDHFFTWDAAGLGKPNALASDHVFHLLIALPALLFPGDVSAKIVLAFSQCAAALCAYVFARRALAAGRAAACCSAVFYACSPIVVNKIGAGHVAFWIAYALLPLAAERAAAYGRMPSSAVLAQLALLAAACTFQLQFAAFAVIAAFAAAGPNLRRACAAAAVCTLGALTVLVPTAYALASSARYDPVLFQTPRLAWQNGMSSGFPDVLWLAHYVVVYYVVPVAAFTALQICIGIAIAAGATIGRSRFTFAVLFIAGLFFATGTSGPAGPVWSWLYAHVAAATVFRESYDASVLIALAYATGIAGLGTFRPGLAAAAIALTVALVPLAAGALGSTVPNVTAPRTAIDPGRIPEGRIAALPLDSPIVYNGHAPGGVDIFAPSGPNHPSLAEYPTLFPLDALSLSRCACEPWFLDAMARMNVAAIVTRPQMQSADLARQHIHLERASRGVRTVADPHPEIESPARAVPEPFSFEQTARADAVAAADPDAPFPGFPGKPQAVEPAFDPVYDDPSRVWVSAQRWFGEAPDPFTIAQGGVTTRSTAPLRMQLPPGRWAMLYESKSALVVSAGARTMPVIASKHARWVAVEGGDLTIRALRAKSDAIVYRFARGTAGVPAGRFTPIAIERFARRSPTAFDVKARGAVAGPALIVLRERYSPNWTIGGARVLWHGLGDGYANLFLLDRIPENVTISYAPQRTFFALCLLCWLLQGAMLFIAVRQKRAA